MHSFLCVFIQYSLYVYTTEQPGASRGSSAGKESACNAGDLGSIPGLRRSPGGGHGNPFQYSCLENSHGQRCLVGCSPWGHKELDTTEWLSTSHTIFHCVYIPQLLYPLSVGRHLDCFHVLVAVISAAVNIVVLVSFSVMVFSESYYTFNQWVFLPWSTSGDSVLMSILWESSFNSTFVTSSLLWSTFSEVTMLFLFS